jgi:hypothetical protein
MVLYIAVNFIPDLPSKLMSYLSLLVKFAAGGLLGMGVGGMEVGRLLGMGVGGMEVDGLLGIGVGGMEVGGINCSFFRKA